MGEDTARPFDASVSLMAEAPGSSPATWSTVSLAKHIRDTVLVPPSRRQQPEESLAGVLLAVRVLTERGLDGDAFVRYGLGPQLSDRIAAIGSLPQLLNLVGSGIEAEGIDEILASLPSESTAWSRLCAADAALRVESGGSANPDGVFLNGVMEITHDWHARVRAWIHQAGVRELVEWNCPSEADFQSTPESDGTESEVEGHYGWIVDRLTETYLSDWVESSLHREYRWQRGDMPSVFPDPLLQLRPIQRDALNSEIADRAVMGQGDEVQRETVNQLDIQAAQLVNAGHRGSAASIYRLILKISPGNPAIRNNLGFCLIPDEPRKALRYLTTAAKGGYDQPFINTHNRMLCHLLIGNPKEALLIAEDAWSSFMTEQMVPAILWQQRNNSWATARVPDARLAVAELALGAAQALGGETFDKWWTRLQSTAEAARD